MVNIGVNGNRLLRDGRGVSALDRFWRDVAFVPGATHVILLEGINDIGNGRGPRNEGRGDSADPPVAAADVIGAYRQFVSRVQQPAAF